MTNKIFNSGEGPYGNLDNRIMLQNNSIEGRGLFAILPIPKGTIIWVNNKNGPMNINYPILTFEQVSQLGNDERNCILKYGSQLSKNTIQGPLTEEAVLLDYSNFFNHSCTPNVWPIDINHWETCCDVNVGDELTIDYVTFDCNVHSGFPKCNCNSVECRGTIKQNDYMNIDLQKKYKGHFVDFIQTLISLEDHSLKL